MMTKAQIAGIARALAAALGGYLVGAGWVDQAMAEQLAGAAVTVAVAIWCVFPKKQAGL